MKSYFIVLVLLGILVSACTEKIIYDKEKTINNVETSQELKKFTSVQEIKDFLKNVQATQEYSRSYFLGAELEAVALSSAALKSDSSAQATDFSQTNVQVEGVDEADIVKNDNEYIYMINQDTLIIVDAFPPEDSKILSETKLKGFPRNMFVNDDRLVVFSDDTDEVYTILEYDFMPRPRQTQQTHVVVYDISDRENPKEIKDYSIQGYYYDSRMIDDYIYFIAKDTVYYIADVIDLPVIREGREKILSPPIYYFDNPEDNYVFHTVASFNIKNENDDITAETFMMGYSTTLYVSQDNIYITYQKNYPYLYHQEYNMERFYKVVVPLLPSHVRNNIEDIKENPDLHSYEKWEQISDILEEMYNTMDEDEKDDLIKEIEEAIDEYDAQLQEERTKTVIHKIAIADGHIEYEKKGEVKGQLLNQFSLDEYSGDLRVATTTSYWLRNRGSVQYNNVYIFDGNMNVIGEVEKIAPDERIYSTRFIQERLYMVTFKRIDPLFVIDLSDSRNPKILGELKIPGFSDYLHPYDENHIIGVGKETADNEFGGTSIKGVKLAFFDVSDVENPKQIDSYEIGDAGTDSEALRDHKAFLFDREKDILVIPIREVKEGYSERRPGIPEYYQQKIWQGVYVFGIDPDTGFIKKGTISHYEGEEEYRYYWRSPYAIIRSLFMDDFLYTISLEKIKVNKISAIDEEINEINLPYKGDYYGYPIYSVVEPRVQQAVQ